MRIAGDPLRNPVSAWLRLGAFLAWSGAVCAWWCLRRLFLPRSTWSVAAAGYTRAWGRGVLGILGIRLRVQGAPPDAPCFLVTNHLGYLDIAVIASQVPVTFVSKAEVARWPLFGTLASLSDTFFLNRGSVRDAERVNRGIARLFASGGSLALFPEGTSTGGREVAPFHSALLRFPADTGFPVHCAALRYRAPDGMPPASRSMCWWGDAPFLPHFLNLFRMRGMEATLAFSGEVLRDADRKALAERARLLVRKCLGYQAPVRERIREAMA